MIYFNPLTPKKSEHKIISKLMKNKHAAGGTKLSAKKYYNLFIKGAIKNS